LVCRAWASSRSRSRLAKAPPVSRWPTPGPVPPDHLSSNKPFPSSHSSPSSQASNNQLHTDQPTNPPPSQQILKKSPLPNSQDFKTPHPHRPILGLLGTRIVKHPSGSNLACTLDRSTSCGGKEICHSKCAVYGLKGVSCRIGGEWTEIKDNTIWEAK